MKIYIIESENNKEIASYLKEKHQILNIYNISEADVIIVNKVHNIKLALNIIDCALNLGKEIICIKNRFGKEYYVSNYLIKNGAISV